MSDHYDVRGSGPVLLIIPGGAGHPMGLENTTALLSERFTVVTYDPLGLAHGQLGKPVEEQRVEWWSEGAARVLDAVLPEGESAYVFGTSSGAIAALDLASRHPDRLRHVIAHEPPVVAVLPDAERQRTMFTEVRDTYRARGIEAASVHMTAGFEERALTQEELAKESNPEAQAPSPADELTTPMAVLLTRVLVPFTSYAPDLAALSAPSPGSPSPWASTPPVNSCTAPPRSSPAAQAAPPASSREGISGCSPTRRSSRRVSGRR